MTDYTTLPNTAVGVGGLPSGATVTALRDNPIAICEGATGAPRIYGLAAATELEYLTLYPFTGVGAGNTPLPAIAYSGSFTDPVETLSNTYITAGTITVTALATGTFRFFATARGEDTGTPEVSTKIRLMKNGVQVQEWISSTTANTSASVDVAAAVDDTFEWHVARNSGLLDLPARISNIVIGIDDFLTTVGLPVKASEL